MLSARLDHDGNSLTHRSWVFIVIFFSSDANKKKATAEVFDLKIANYALVLQQAAT